MQGILENWCTLIEETLAIKNLNYQERQFLSEQKLCIVQIFL